MLFFSGGAASLHKYEEAAVCILRSLKHYSDFPVLLDLRNKAVRPNPSSKTMSVCCSVMFSSCLGWYSCKDKCIYKKSKMTFKLLSMSVVTALLYLFLPFIIVITFLIGLLLF